MKKLLAVLLVAFVISCGQDIPGPQGSQGLPGEVGSQGEKGDKGDKGDTGNVGAQGPQGIQGVQGLQGVSGANGLDGTPGTVLTMIKFCPLDSHNFPEQGMKIGTDIYAVYWSGSTAFLTKLIPGTYRTTSISSMNCYFTVHSDGSITN